MALCSDPGCAIAAGSGVFISGSGTPGDPWLISVTDPTDIVEIENDIANIQAALLTAASTYVNAAGDTMTGTLNMRATAGDQIRLHKPTSADSASITFYDDTGTMRGYVGVLPSNEIALGAHTHSLLLYSTGAERARFDGNGSMLIGKTTDSVATTGCYMAPWGNFHTSTAISSWNCTHAKTSTAVAAGQIFEQFYANGSSVGNFYLATTSTLGVIYTSDRDLKENVESIDDELALIWMRDVEPVFFNYKIDTETQHVGYIAQDVAEAWPNAVSNGIVREGHGNAEDRTWDDDGQETTPTDVWEPWGVDYGRLTPFLHASIQALDRLTLAQQTEIDDLKAANLAQARQIATLSARLDALEAQPR